MIQKFKEGQKVQLKYGFKFKPEMYKVFGYANPEYDDLVYIIDAKNIISTVPESSLELVRDKLHYKGYTSPVHFNEADQLFFGNIEDIMALVTWESEVEAHCQKEFESAVDEYLEFCKCIGADPKA